MQRNAEEKQKYILNIGMRFLHANYAKKIKLVIDKLKANNTCQVTKQASLLALTKREDIMSQSNANLYTISSTKS